MKVWILESHCKCSNLALAFKYMLSDLVIFICKMVFTVKTAPEYIVRINQNDVFKSFLKINRIERLILSDYKNYYKASV